MSEKRVKTRKVVKRRLKIKGVLFLVAVFALLYFGVSFILTIKVDNITISGNSIIKQSELLKTSGLTDGVKFFDFTSPSICNRIEENPLVKTCKVKRNLDLSIEIIIEENVPLFYYTTDAKVVLSNGAKVDIPNTFGIPTLINYVPEQILVEFASRLGEVKGDIIHSISEIEYSPSASKEGVFIDEERFILLMNDGNTIYINNKRLNVLNRYDEVYASIGDKKGIFNFDCDYGNYPFTEYEA